MYTIDDIKKILENKENLLNSMNLFELNRKIDKWCKINLKTIKESELQRSLLETLSGLMVNSAVYDSQEFYRVRKIDTIDQIKFKSDIWYPPKKYCKKMGRLNLPNESKLYCSLDKATPFIECDIQVGDRVAFITYVIKNDSRLQLTNIVNDNEPDGLNESGRIAYNIIKSFIRNEFTKPVGFGTEYLYRVSNRICIDLMDIPNCDGFIYPSIATFQNTYNVAIKPESADKSLDFKCVEILEVTNINEELNQVNFNKINKSSRVVNDIIEYM